MKKIILVLFILLAINLFSILYVADGTASYEKFETSYNLEHIGHNYVMTGEDFTNVPFTKNCTTIGFANGNNTVARGIVTSKTDNRIEFCANTNAEINADSFFMQVSRGHALWCRNILISESGSNPDDVYVGTIGYQFNLIGVAIPFGIEIVSISQSGMNDNSNKYYGFAFTEAGILVIQAHGNNRHELYDYTTYIGDIVTVSYCSGTETNKGSYGDGLEFLIQYATTQSQATQIFAGMVYKLHEETGKSWNEIRTALKETASENGDWNSMEGYGYVNYNLALAELMATLNEYIIVINKYEYHWFRDWKEFSWGGNDYVFPLVTRHKSRALICNDINDLKYPFSFIQKYYPSAYPIKIK